VLKQLEGDLRRLMSPNTATALRETRRNALKDFVHVAGPLGVTHFLILTATQRASYLRICKASRGPTLTMRVQEHSLMRDVLSSQQRPRVPKVPPCRQRVAGTGGGGAWGRVPRLHSSSHTPGSPTQQHLPAAATGDVDGAAAGGAE
jgi:hypothetical protein